MDENKKVVEDAGEVTLAKPPVKLSDEAIDEKVKELEQILINNHYQYSDKAYRLAREIIINDKEVMDDKTYCLALYAYHLHYEHHKKLDEDVYVMIELYRLIMMKQNKLPRAKALILTDFTVPEIIKKAVFEVCAFVPSTLKKIKKRFIMVQLAIGLVFAFIAFGLLHINIFVVLLIIAAVTLINCKISLGTVEKVYFQEQAMTSSAHCKDKELVDFDRRILNS